MVQGVVKWFNNKAGYGFVRVEGEDIFVHHSSIVVSKEQYKYLVQGEYVELEKEESEGVHKVQGKNVRGIGGGPLMCETRNENRRERENNRESEWKYVKPREEVKKELAPREKKVKERKSRTVEPPLVSE